MDVTFHEYSQIEDHLIKYAVIAAQYQGKWIFCRHKERSTWELPGGHREAGETAMETAHRELYEETGATDADIHIICVYQISNYGLFCYAQVNRFDTIPADSEIGEICMADSLSENLTYSAHAKLFSYAQKWLISRR